MTDKRLEFTIGETPAIIVECRDWDQVEQVAKKGVSEGYKVLASGAGVVLIKDLGIAIRSFQAMIKVYAENMDEDGIAPIVECTDSLGTRAIAIGINTKMAAYLYGVEPQEFLSSQKEGIVRTH